MNSALRLLTPAFLLSVCGIFSAHAGSYDGRWSVQLATDQGACALSYQGTLEVINGRINESGVFGQATGTILRKGLVRLRITRGSDVVAAEGILSNKTGMGKWVLATQSCSGRWVASRA